MIDVADAPAMADIADVPSRDVAPRKAKPRKRKGKCRTGRKLFQHDRALGVRFVAGADEAGRGCLAGPLVAAAVLFDYDRLGPREVRALSLLNDSKQHTEEAREALYPVVLRIATRVAVVSRSAGGIDRRGLHKTNLAALRESLLKVARPGCICLSDGFPVGDLEGYRAARSSTATRRAPPSPPRASSPRSPATASCIAPTRATPAGSSRRTSATRHRSTATRSNATASRRCIACRFRALPTSSSRCSTPGAHVRRAIRTRSPDAPAA